MQGCREARRQGNGDDGGSRDAGMRRCRVTAMTAEEGTQGCGDAG